MSKYPKDRDENFIHDRILILDNGCWEWQLSKDKDGYGQTSGLGECKAHRLSFRIFKGDIPLLTLVCHSCDYKPCCNPEHLFLGSEYDNMMDAVNKGIYDPKVQSQHANSFHTTTRETVEAIRMYFCTIGGTHEAISKVFGVSRQTVSNIINGNHPHLQSQE